jgi:hypothetical protein
MPKPTARTSFPLLLSLSVSGAALALPPANDACDAPEAISGLGMFPFSTVEATTDGSTSAACLFFSNDQIHNDVWFLWSSEAGGLVSVTTCGQTALDSKIAVYASSKPCPDAAAVIACNDDACSLQSRLTFAAAPQTDYVIRLGSYGAAQTGSGALVIESGALVDTVNPANGRRYVGFPTTTWAAAAAMAEMLGGHLVAIDDEAENEFVRVEFGNALGVDRRVWIGLTDEGSEGDWRWTDGSPVSFTNWNPGEPNNSGGTEHYAELLGSSGLWNDLSLSGSGFPHIACVELGAGGGGPCLGDFDQDGTIGPADLSTLLAEWSVPKSFGDLDGDGAVGASDLTILLGGWGDCP